jgi:ketosteroid isomerase-like protein
MEQMSKVEGGGTEADHQNLREMKALYESAISQNQLEKLVPLLDENFSFVTFTDSVFDLKKESFDKFKSDWDRTRNSMLEGGSYQVKLDPERSLVYGDFALAKGIAYHKITKGSGKSFEFPGQWTVFLRKTGEGWKIVRAHSSVSSFNNTLLQDYVKGQLLKTGLISALGGILLGGAIVYFFLRKKVGV